jgi:hypothetical protein
LLRNSDMFGTRRRAASARSSSRLWFCVLALLAGNAQAEQAAAERVGCVEVWPEARYRNDAYDHIVHLRSRCRARVICDVATNVNPKAIRVSVPAGQDVEVLTYRGSPAREFTPTVQCMAVARASRSVPAFSVLGTKSAPPLDAWRPGPASAPARRSCEREDPGARPGRLTPIARNALGGHRR